MRRIPAIAGALSLGLFLQPAGAAIQYFDITGSTANSENACPAWVLPIDDCSYNDRDLPGTGAEPPWIGPIFNAGYYAPGAAPLIYTTPAPSGPVTAPQAVLPTTGKTGIPIARGFISINDAGTAGDISDDVVLGTIEFGEFERNVAVGATTRVIESFDRIIHRIATAAPNVISRVSNGTGFDYVIGRRDTNTLAVTPISGSTTADGGFSDTFPSEVASQSSSDPSDVPYWSAPGTRGLARFEGTTAEGAEGNRTAATIWGYVCDAAGSALCESNALNWDTDPRASIDNLRLAFSTDGSGNITSATAFLVNQTDLVAPFGPTAEESWNATTLTFTGAATVLPQAYDDRALFINGADTATIVAVLFNDLPGVAVTPVTVTIVTPPTQGTATVETEASTLNSIEYVPTAPGTFEGIDTLRYRITDNNGQTSEAIVEIVRTDEISCSNDTAVVDRNDSVVIDVLANDAGFDLPPILVSVISGPSAGTAVVNADNTVTFTPPADTGGSFTFGYQVNDGTNDPKACTVTIQADDNPVAVADPGLTAENNQSATLEVLTNDTGKNNTPLSLAITTPPAHGNAFVVAAGATPAFIRYTPTVGYEGVDTLSYRIIDADGDLSNIALVTITISDQHPVAVNDPTLTAEDGIATVFNVVSNDTSRNDTPLTLEIVTQPANGTATVTTGASGLPAISYTSVAGFTGAVTVTYRISDSDDDESNVATATITVVDTQPATVNDTANGDSRVASILDVVANDTGKVDLPLTLEITQAPTNGTATVVTGAIPAISYRSNLGFAGTDTLQYRLTDSDGDVSPLPAAIVTITVTNLPLDAEDDAATVENGVSTAIPVLNNDDNRSNFPLTLQITQQPAHGTVSVTSVAPPGLSVILYRSTGSYTGADQFRYSVTDGDNESSEAVVNVTVVDSTPVAQNDTSGQAGGCSIATGDAREPTALDVLCNDTGLADRPVTLQITQQPTLGTATQVTIVRDDGSIWPGISYTSNDDAIGSDTIRYTVTDSTGAVSNIATVTLTVADSVPNAVDDVGGDEGLMAASSSGRAITGLFTALDVLENDTGRGNRPNTIVITQQPANGEATVDLEAIEFIGRPGIIYQSNEGYTGPETFRYKVVDGDGDEDEATVTFNVVSILTATADGNPQPLLTNRDRSITIDVLDNDGGLAFAPVSIEIVEDSENNGTATVNADNTVTFTPEPGFTGRWDSEQCPPLSCALGGASFAYRLTDQQGQTAQTAAFIDVLPPQETDQGGSSLDKELLALLLAGAALRRGRPRKRATSA